MRAHRNEKESYMVRDMIAINEDLCDGCGLCVPDCPEGALQVIDGKVRLVGEVLCDGLGACIGRCPTGAIFVEKREAEPYDEEKVLENILPQGTNTLLAHLNHLKDHNATEYLNTAQKALQAMDFPEKQKVMSLFFESPKPSTQGQKQNQAAPTFSGCPGSMARSLKKPASRTTKEGSSISGESALAQWPIQMHLINPGAPYFQESDFLLAADCTAFTIGSFHPTLLEGKTLGIACPKLDEGQDSYLNKLMNLINESKINTLTVAIMEVPCCGGLARVAEEAVKRASRKIPLKKIVISIEGEILSQDWV